MAIFKCKICGGSLEIDSAQSVATCEYCGTKQTLPKLDNERRANLYDRANHFRRNNDFDKAMGIYENILNEDNTDAEAYWSIVLCRYGIEYVEDSTTHKRVPTINRAQYTSIFDDEDYKSAIANADDYQREFYQAEANVINEIQKGILDISQKEDPFDVFICYKETDASGRRTPDSVLAQDLYFQLKQEGLKVFFSRITLEDKVGSAYEPYIFAALNSAKIMVVLGTKQEYFNSAWVKNEWSRYLALIKQGQKKTLVPAYRDMDPYDLPEEFSHIQAQDMSKLGFMQDLIRGIRKIVKVDEPKATTVIKETLVTSGNVNTAPLLKRVFIFLEDGDWDSANEYCEKVLDMDPENAQAYLGKLMSELHVKKKLDLQNCSLPFDNRDSYKKVIRFADQKLKDEMSGYILEIVDRNEKKRLADQYASCLRAKELATSEQDYISVAKRFAEMGSYGDAASLHQECMEKAESVKKEAIERAEIARKNAIYSHACQLKARNNLKDLEQAIAAYKEVEGWKNSHNLICECEDRISAIKAEREQARLEHEKRVRIAQIEREKRAKKRNKFLKIAIPAMFALLVIVLIAFFLIIPMIRVNDAISLMESGAYNEAKAVLVELNGFGTSDGKIAIIDAIDDIENGDFESAINKIISSGEDVNVKYILNGGTSMEGDYVTYSSDTEVTTLIVPKKEGYWLAKWSLSDYFYTKANSIEIVLDAVWSDEYKITYELNGGASESNPQRYNKDGDEIVLKNPTRKGYTFIGWTGTDLSGLTMEVTIPRGSYGDREYIANWEKHGKITYNLNGGSAKNITTYTFQDDDFTLINPTRTGFTFIGWTGTDLDGLTMEVTIPKGSHGDREFTANWRANSYTISLDANGGKVDVASISVDYQSKYSLPTPNRDYYTFSGWYDGGTKYSDNLWKKADDITLVAKWTPVKYIISYNLNTGLNTGANSEENPKLYTVETPTITLQEPTRKGYKFLGWYRDAEYKQKVTEISKGSHGDVVLYAKWEVATYTITYNFNGGVASGTVKKTFTINDLPVALPTATKTDCVFLGWKNTDYNGASITSIKECGDITVYATFMDVYLQLELHEPYYSWDDDETYYSVKKYSGSASVVDIPDYYEGYPVRKIGSSAFKDNTTIISVNIPNTVNEIGSSAFDGCTALTRIIIPDGVTAISSYTFEGCASLLSVSIPDTVTFIGASAFSGCSSLSAIVLPRNLSTLESYAFKNCIKLTEISVPGTVSELPSYAFYGCTNLETVELNEGLTRINYNAFTSKKINKIVIPKSVSYISSTAFCGSSYYYSDEAPDCVNALFFCRSATMPANWQNGWNLDRPVIWGYDESTYKAPTYRFMTNGGTVVNPITQVVVNSSPSTRRSGYVLVGWYDNGNFEGEAVTFPYYSTSQTTLYAKWELEATFYDGTSFARAHSISSGKEITAEITSSDRKLYYRFIPTESKNYKITSNDKPYAYCTVYDSDQNKLDYDYASSYGYISISYDFVAGQEYFIVIEPYSSSKTGPCIFKIE